MADSPRVLSTAIKKETSIVHDLFTTPSINKNSQIDDTTNVINSEETLFNYENLKLEHREEIQVDEQEVDRNIFFTTLSQFIDSIDMKFFDTTSTTIRTTAQTSTTTSTTTTTTTTTKTRTITTTFKTTTTTNYFNNFFDFFFH